MAFVQQANIECFLEKEIIINRNYDLFSALAGVRSKVNALSPRFPPRGIPDVLSKVVFQDYYAYVLDEWEQSSAGYYEDRLSAERYVSNGWSHYKDHHLKKNGWVSCPDWHSTSWLFRDEIDEAILSFPKSDEPLFDDFYRTLEDISRLESQVGFRRVRSVFWFDN